MSLIIKNLCAGYETSQVLFGVNLTIPSGSLVTLLGRNGMGKTSTVRSIMGMIPRRAGTVLFNNTELINQESHKIAAMGIGLVPEGRRIFPTLSVRENLIATATHHRHSTNSWTLEKIITMFPNLGNRLDHGGAQLSGGEQQMLAIGRALMTNPELLILDEATEGLAPLVRDEIWACLERLKSTNLSILLIDKNLDKVTQIADQHFIMEKGQIVWQGNSSQLQQDIGTVQTHLGI